MDPISSSSFSYKRSTPALEPDAESGEEPIVKRQTIGSSPFDDSSVDRTSQIAEEHISPIETKLANSPLLQRSFSGPERDSAGIGTSIPKSPNMCVVPPVSVSSSSLSSASLELSKMWAVHATDYLPTNGSICTRLSNNETILKETRSDIYPSDVMRSTIHFTIGSVVSKHEGMDVDRKYAILLPVEKLLPQMIAINPFDTIILGNLSLDPEAVIIVPQGTEVPGFPGRIEFYDVEKNSDSSLRQKVNECLRKTALYRLNLSGGGQCVGLNGTALLEDGRVYRHLFLQHKFALIFFPRAK